MFTWAMKNSSTTESSHEVHRNWVPRRKTCLFVNNLKMLLVTGSDDT